MNTMEPRYYSHVLYFPGRKPFDNDDLRWPSFIGAFVAPLVQKNSELQYWFTYYGAFARFRVFTADYEALRPNLDSLRDKLGLVDKGEEKDLTIEGDLGGSRFHGPNSKVPQAVRARTILRSLKTVSDLMVESVIQRADAYWEFEGNGDAQQNPISGHRFSVCHLFHNLMDSKGRVFSFHDAQGHEGVLSYYYFLNARQRGNLAVVSAQHHDILL
jgi:hypothetical protein